MNAKLLATVSMVALTLGACSANSPKSVVDTAEIRYTVSYTHLTLPTKLEV